MALRVSFGPRLSISIEHSFWFTALMLGFFGTGGSGRGMLIWVSICLVSVLVHELGHALTMIAFGGGARIQLYAMGGVTHPTGTPQSTAARYVMISAAGPLAGLLLAGGAFLSRQWIYTHASLEVFIFTNGLWQLTFYWSLINLLPIEPMDGGHLMTIVLRARWGTAGLKVAYWIGAACAGALALHQVLVGRVGTAVMLGAFGLGIVQRLRGLALLSPQDEDPAIRQAFEEARALIATDEKAAAQKLIAVRKQAQSGLIHAAATEHLGLLLQRSGDYGAAYPLLSSVEKALSTEGRKTLQWLACQAGDYEKAASLGQSLFPMDRDPRVAYTAAAAYAGLGDRDRALHWLRSAVRLSPELSAAWLREKHFDRFRADPEFQALGIT